MEGISRTKIAFVCSLFLHLVGFFLLPNVFKPATYEPVCKPVEVVSIFFSRTTRTIPKRRIERKAVILASASSLQKTKPRARSPARGRVDFPATRHKDDVLVSAIEPGAGWGVGQDAGKGTDSGDGLGGSGSVARARGFSPAKIGLTIGPARARRIRISTASPLETARYIFPGIARELPTAKVDVVFAISCGSSMQKYLKDATDLMEDKIQQYRLTSHHYSVGIIASRLLSCDDAPDQRHRHQIGRLPLSSNLDEALAAVREMQNLECVGGDILLNTIYYALNRCSFRPDALHRMIVIGSDAPMFGGFSPLNIIELCHKKQVVLDIYRADRRISPLLASETGGQWYPLDDEMESADVAIRSRNVPFTMDQVSEFRLGNWRRKK